MNIKKDDIYDISWFVLFWAEVMATFTYRCHNVNITAGGKPFSWILTSSRRWGSSCQSTIFKNSSLPTCCEIVLRCMLQNLTNEESKLVHVMAWCHQATNHYLSQRWLRSMPPYCITMPQWVQKHLFWLERYSTGLSHRMNLCRLLLIVNYNKCHKECIDDVLCKMIKLHKFPMAKWYTAKCCNDMFL